MEPKEILFEELLGSYVKSSTMDEAKRIVEGVEGGVCEELNDEVNGKLEINEVYITLYRSLTLIGKIIMRRLHYPYQVSNFSEHGLNRPIEGSC